MGSCVPLQIISAAFDPHCWNATSFADPEYVMDFKSPNAFCALATTVFASCAMALAHRNARQITTTVSFFSTASPLIDTWLLGRTHPSWIFYIHSVSSHDLENRTPTPVPSVSVSSFGLCGNAGHYSLHCR